MIHQLIFARPKPKLPEVKFQDYWLNVHAKKYASKIRQIRRYLIDLRVPVRGLPRELPGLFSAAEIWLANAKEQLASLQSRAFLQGARPDEPRWAAFWATFGLDTTSYTLLSDPRFAAQDDRLKLLVLLKRRPGLSLEKFRRVALADRGAQVKQLPGLRHYVQGHVLDAFYEVGESRFDAVEQLWFEDAATLTAALKSGVYRNSVVRSSKGLIDPRYEFMLACRARWIVGPEEREPDSRGRL